MIIKRLLIPLFVITIILVFAFLNKDYINEVRIINDVKSYKDINKLKKINKDTISYIKIKGTKVDYPIVQTKDNDYYLKHSFDKSENKFGWIFMDYRNDMFNDRHTIIYGHTIDKKLMFASLKNVLDNPSINEIGIFEDGKFQTYLIYSVYITKPVNDYLRIAFDDKEYKTFLEKTKKKSIYEYYINPKVEDKLLTLSTCFLDDQRLVIHAIKE